MVLFNNHFFDFLHIVISKLGRIIALVLFIFLAFSWLSSKLGAYLPHQRTLVFLLLAFVLGPGLVVNVIFSGVFTILVTYALYWLLKPDAENNVLAAP